MFDIGWTELVVIACVAILVVGPKDLPGMLRAFGKTVGNLRRMAGDFQRQFDQALKEAELDQVSKAGKAALNPLEEARKSVKAIGSDVTQSLNEVKKEAEKPAAAAGNGSSPPASQENDPPSKSAGKPVEKSAAGPRAKAATEGSPAKTAAARKTKPAGPAGAGKKRAPAKKAAATGTDA